MDYPGKVITKTQVTPTQTSASGNWTLDDQAAAIKNNNWPVALVPNPISKSLRFNSADSTYLNRTPAGSGTLGVWTFSFWVKRAALSVDQTIFYSGTTNQRGGIRFTSGDLINCQPFNSTGANASWTSTAVFRDSSAWYHVVIRAFSSATGNSFGGVELALYINGVQQTFTLSTAGTPTGGDRINDSQAKQIGQITPNGGGDYLSAYLTEFNFIDGQALTPSSFGMTNPQTGQWIPLKYSGTYGTNGFYLNFKDATSTTTLGYDYSGNANNWTTNNFSVTAGVGNDSLTDVPTPWIAYNTTGDVGGVVRGNYNTLNSAAPSTGTISNGNLTSYSPTTTVYSFAGTMLITTGKWYWEVTATTINSANQYPFIGTYTVPIPKSLTGAVRPGADTGIGGFSLRQNGDFFYNNNTSATITTSFTTGDVIGIAFDADAQSVTYYKNGSSIGTQGSLGAGPWVTACSEYNGSLSNHNFGQRPFAYTPPSGFLSLCTTNLPASTVLKGSDYFNAVLWTGNSTASQAITGVGFQPDLVWAKSRPANSGQDWVDAVRGATKNIQSNSTAAETTSNTVISFQSDGFTVGDGLGYDINKSGESVVGWCWNAGGSTVTNTSGTISAQVRANTTAGFSIVTYTGNGIDGATVGHGLGVVPSMVIQKRRDGGIANFRVWHSAIYATSGVTDTLFLNSTAASGPDGDNISGVSSTTFTTRGTGGTNPSGNGCVAYVFAAISGFSAFGKYTGNGSADGPFVYTGFRPRYVLIKISSTTGNWYLLDTARSPYNEALVSLNPNTSSAEATDANFLDILSNGFKLRTTGGAVNGSSATIIYAAFAENPFKNALAR